MIKSADLKLAPRRPPSAVPMAPEGWTHEYVLRPGAKRTISAVQLASNEAGATSKDGLQFFAASFLIASSSAKTEWSCRAPCRRPDRRRGQAWSSR